MDSLIDVGDNSQSPRGLPTPWSPVRARRRRGNLSPITLLHSDPHSQHAELADTKYGVDVIFGAQLQDSEEQLLEPAPTGCATDVQPQAVDSVDDEVCF